MRVADAVRDSLDEVRRIARELRPEALDDLGLVNALIALCSRVDAQGGPRVRRELQGKLPPLPPDVELVIYRVAQESADQRPASRGRPDVTVSLTADAEELTLTVNGRRQGDAGHSRRAGTAGIARHARAGAARRRPVVDRVATRAGDRRSGSCVPLDREDA